MRSNSDMVNATKNPSERRKVLDESKRIGYNESRSPVSMIPDSEIVFLKRKAFSMVIIRVRKSHILRENWEDMSTGEPHASYKGPSQISSIKTKLNINHGIGKHL